MIERLRRREKASNRLTSLPDQDLSSYINRQRQALRLLRIAGHSSDSAFGAALILISISFITQNETMFIASGLIGATSLVTAYSTAFADGDKLKTINKAENEAVRRGLMLKENQPKLD